MISESGTVKEISNDVIKDGILKYNDSNTINNIYVPNEEFEVESVTVNDFDVSYDNKLESYGLNLFDINRINNGEITIEALIQEIENDSNGYRRRKINEAAYLKSANLDFNSLDELNSTINSNKSKLVELIKERNEIDNRELDYIMNVIASLKMGYDLDSILASRPVAYQYININGEVCYKYDNPYQSGELGEITYTPIYFKDMYGDSELLNNLKSLLEKEEKKSLFGDSKAVYVWNNSVEQNVFFDSIQGKYDTLKKNREEKLEVLDDKILSLQEETDGYEYAYNCINNQLDYYMTYVDSYTHKSDFDLNNSFNSECLNIVDKIKNEYSTNMSYNGEPEIVNINDKSDLVNVITSMINGEVSITSGGYLSTGTSVIQLGSKDDMLAHYIDWSQLISDEEKEVLNYIYNTNGVDAAYKYLEDISDQLDYRWFVNKTQEDQEYASDHKVLSSFASIVTAPIEGISAVCYSLNSLVNGDKIRRSDVYSTSDVWRTQVSQDIASNYGEGWAFAYNTGMSMADSVSLIGVTAATGGVGSIVFSGGLMGSRAYVSTLNDALNRGLSDGEAVLLAGVSAIVESAMENYSVGHLINLEGKLGKTTLKLTSDIASKIEKENIANIVTKTFYVGASALSQGVAEGEEEFATEVLNYIADIFISKDLSNYTQSINQYLELGYNETQAAMLTMQDFIGQAGQAFLGGFVSGICFGSFSGVKSTVKTSYGISQKMYGELNGSTSAQKFASALEINQQQIQQYNEALKDIKAGKNLTLEQISLLNNGTVGMQVSKELMDKFNDVFYKENFVNNIDTANIKVDEIKIPKGRSYKFFDKNNLKSSIDVANSQGVVFLESVTDIDLNILSQINKNVSFIIKGRSYAREEIMSLLKSENMDNGEQTVENVVNDGVNTHDDFKIDNIKRKMVVFFDKNNTQFSIDAVNAERGNIEPVLSLNSVSDIDLLTLSMIKKGVSFVVNGRNYTKTELVSLLIDKANVLQNIQDKISSKIELVYSVFNKNSKLINISSLIDVVLFKDVYDKFLDFKNNEHFFAGFTREEYLEGIMQLVKVSRENNIDLGLNQEQNQRLNIIYDEALNIISEKIIDLVSMNKLVMNEEDLEIVAEEIRRNYWYDDISNNPLLIFSKTFKFLRTTLLDYLLSNSFNDDASIVGELQDESIDIIVKKNIAVGKENFAELLSMISTWTNDKSDYVKYWANIYDMNIDIDNIRLDSILDKGDLNNDDDLDFIYNCLNNEYSLESIRSNPLLIFDDLFKFYCDNVLHYLAWSGSLSPSTFAKYVVPLYDFRNEAENIIVSQNIDIGEKNFQILLDYMMLESSSISPLSLQYIDNYASKYYNEKIPKELKIKNISIYKNKVLDNFYDIMETGTKSSFELINLLADTLSSRIQEGDNSAFFILEKIIKLKKLYPELSLEAGNYDNSDNPMSSCFWRPSNKSIVIGGLNIAWEDNGTLIHELGHCLFSTLLGSQLPNNWSNILDKARTISGNDTNLKETIVMLQRINNFSRLDSKKRMQREIEEQGMDLEEFKDMLVAEYNYVLEMPRQDLESFLREEGFSLELITSILNNKYTALELAIQDYNSILGTIQEEINRKQYGYACAISDIIDAVFLGVGKDLNGQALDLTYVHGEEYYQEAELLYNGGAELLAFDEIIANFTQLKLTGDSVSIQLIRKIFGEEFFNALEETYNKFID